MTLKKKCILFFITALCIVSFSAGSYLAFEKKQFLLLAENLTRRNREVFEKLLEFKSETLHTFVYDYAWWDAAVDFIHDHDIGWADDNLIPGLATYDADYVWALDTRFDLVYSASADEKRQIKEFPLKKQALKRLVARDNGFSHFYIETKYGVVEMQGAKVVYEEDEERTGPAQGYLWAGRLWDDVFLKELARATDAAVVFSPTGSYESASDTAIVVSKTLFDQDGVALADILFVTEEPTLVWFQRITAQVFVMITVFAAALLVAIYIFFILWVLKPLVVVSGALREGKVDYLSSLLRDKTEFGDLYRLIDRFFTAQKELVHEIKMRQRTEESLRQEKEKARHYLNIAAVMLLALDKEGNVILINKKGCELLGYTESEIIGKNWFSTFIPDSVRSQAKRIFLALIAGKTALTEYHESFVLTKSGRERRIAWHNTPLTDADGAIVGTLSSGEDISYRREIEKSQRLAQLGRFVAEMAHEVNNPLMVISGRAQLLLMEENPQETTKKALEKIVDECQRAKCIIRRILKYSKPPKGKVEEIDIHATIDETIGVLEHQFSLENIRVVKNYAPGLSHIVTDQKQLQEVLMNLFVNAREAITGEGQITITAAAGEGVVTVTIEDTGCGMAEETIEKIDEPFFTTKETGIGLGIAICRAIIKNLGGTLVFKSEPGKGTTATITLPV